MSNKNSDDSKRKLLKSIAAGSGAVVASKSLPEAWSKPVVHSVILPVHAESSPITPNPGTTSEATTPSPGLSCTQCGQQLLEDNVGEGYGWNSTLVTYDSSDNSYLFHNAGSNMRQLVILDKSCVGSTLRLNLIDGGGTGPLKVSVAVGNTVKEIIYRGGGLSFDFIVPPGPTHPAFVDIKFDKTPLDITTKILSPTWTVVC